MVVEIERVICDTCGKERQHRKAMVYGLPEGWVAKNRRQFCSQACADAPSTPAPVATPTPVNVKTPCAGCGRMVYKGKKALCRKCRS